MKYSIFTEIQSLGMNPQETSIGDVDSDRIDETLQVTVFKTPEGRPIQVLFGGDRLVSANLVRILLGQDDILLDIRFFPRMSYPFGKFIRQAPLSEKQGLITIIDKNVLDKVRVHVISKPGQKGYFIKPKNLKIVFEGAIIADVTEPVITSTIVVSPSLIGHQNEGRAREQIKKYLGDPKSYLPVFLLPSTRNEILSLHNSSSLLSAELADVIESDPIMLFHFLQSVFDSRREVDQFEIASMSIFDIIKTLGLNSSLDIASKIANDSSEIKLDVSGVSVIPQYFRFSHLCAEISALVIEKSNTEELVLSPDLIRNLTKAYRGIIGIMFGMTEPEKIKDWIETTNANPHRYEMDTQFNVLGFTIMDLGKYLTKSLRFPSCFEIFFSNFGSPFYQGPYSDYVITNYIVSSFISEREEIDSALFKHIFKLHRHLAIKRESTEHISDALKSIPQILKKYEVLMWRFETVKKEMASDYLSVSKIDRSYFVYR